MKIESKSNYLTEGIIVAVVTLFIYIIAFEYESGFCSFWKIPKCFINISVANVVSAGLGLFSLLWGSFMLVNLPVTLLHEELSKEDSFRRRIIVVHLGILFIFFVMIQSFGFSLWLILIFVFLTLMVDFIHLFIPWYADKKENTESADFFTRITRSYDTMGEQRSSTHWLKTLIGNHIYVLIFLIPIVNMFAFAAGYASAKASKNYLVIESENLLLITRYGETSILRHIDLQNNKVSGEFFIWQNEDIAKHKFSSKLIRKIEII